MIDSISILFYDGSRSNSIVDPEIFSMGAMRRVPASRFGLSSYAQRRIVQRADTAVHAADYCTVWYERCR